MDQNDRLNELLWALFMEVAPGAFEKIRDFDFDSSSTSDPFSVTTITLDCSPKYVSILDQIVKEIGPRFALKREAILDVLLEELKFNLSDELAHPTDEHIDAAFLATARRLRDPQKSYHFSFPISVNTRFEFEFALEGEEIDLKVTSAPDEELGSNVCTLSGTVSAVLSSAAIYQVERYIKVILGTFISMGLANYRPVRIRKIPTIMMSNIPCILPAEVSAFIAGTTIELVADEFDDIAIRRLQGEAEQVIGPIFNKAAYVISALGERGRELNSAVHLYVDALLASEPGRAVASALMSLEAVLLENSKSDVSARLKEAVAFRLGRNSMARKKLRKCVDNLYSLRSSYVHGRSGDVREESRDEAVDLARQAIRFEINNLDVSATQDD